MWAPCRGGDEEAKVSVSRGGDTAWKNGKVTRGKTGGPTRKTMAGGLGTHLLRTCPGDTFILSLMKSRSLPDSVC